MKPTIAKTAARAAIGLALAGLGALAAAQQAPAIGKGQRYYEKICAKCHEAGIGPVLKGRGLPEAYFMVIPRSGLNAMPAFRRTDLDDETLKDLAKYLANAPAPVQK